jgi:hypothetical protein
MASILLIREKIARANVTPFARRDKKNRRFVLWFDKEVK